MPRPLRIEYEDAWYHVMNRGANHQNIFFNDHHCQVFITLMQEITENFGCEIHAYCLMDNHYHLLIRTKFANLGRAMRHLNGIYTQRLNRLEKRDGPIFRGRYKSILIEEESYLLAVSRYIHLNPVAARLCELPEQYIWSSYKFYLNESYNHAWLKRNIILKFFSKDCKSYKDFIEEGVEDELINFYKDKTHQTILGSEKFIDSHLNQLNQAKRLASANEIMRLKKPLEFENMLSAVEVHFNTNRCQITSILYTKKNLARIFALFLSKKACFLTHSQIANAFKLNPSSVGNILKRCEKCISDNYLVDLKKLFNKLQINCRMSILDPILD